MNIINGKLIYVFCGCVELLFNLLLVFWKYFKDKVLFYFELYNVLWRIKYVCDNIVFCCRIGILEF